MRSLAIFVAASFSSTPCITESKIAASITERVIGPAVSCVCEIGTIPVRLNKPTVGLMPTIPFAEDGQVIEPLVSVPIAATLKNAATAAPEPELEPHVERFKS